MEESQGIITDDLVKRYGKREVVRGVNLTVRPGEIVGLLGPNGAGKTTSFYMIVGLVDASKGKVFLDNNDITDVPMYRRARMGIGYLPQEPSVFRRLTVAENIRAVVEMHSNDKSSYEKTVNNYLAELELTHLANQMAYTLSGGERRRLEITRALVTEPRFLLMDEPFSGIDPISVHEVQTIILQLKKKGIGILITDHNVRETLSIVDRAYLLHDGKVLKEGTSSELINDPNSRHFYLGENFNL